MSVLIKNGLLYDGSEREAIKTDIFIQGAHIARLGDLGNLRANNIIDAQGAVITPGLIDVNTDSDHHLTLFTNPSQEDFLRQGVTTILGGNCGISLAPFYGESTRALIRSWHVSPDVNIDWHSTREFLKALNRVKLGVNFGTLIGYTNLRNVFGETPRDLTEKEALSIELSIRKNIEEGAFGLSFNIEEMTKRAIPIQEFVRALKALSALKSVASFHLPHGVEVVSALQAIVEYGKELSLNIEINHFQPIEGLETAYKNAKDLIESSSAHLNINFDVFPFTRIAVSIDEMFPSWIGRVRGHELSKTISLTSNRKRILKELSRFDGKECIIGQVPKPLQFIEGRTIKEFREHHELSSDVAALLKLCELTDGRAILFVRSISPVLLEAFLFSPRSIIASNGLSAPGREFKHERSTNTFTEFFRRAKEGGGIAFEKAVAKASSIPAKKYGINDRGSIRENYFADIVVWRENRPTHVLVNGRIALENGALKEMAGTPLRYKKLQK